MRRFYVAVPGTVIGQATVGDCETVAAALARHPVLSGWGVMAQGSRLDVSAVAPAKSEAEAIATVSEACVELIPRRFRWRPGVATAVKLP